LVFYSSIITKIHGPIYIRSSIIFIVTSWVFSDYEMKSLRGYSGAKNIRKIVLTYQNVLKTKG